MFQYYLIACIPAILGGILCYFNKNINWKEWLIGSGCAFLLAGIINLMTVSSMTDDIEYLSGNVISAYYQPEWIETYEEAIYDHWTTYETVGYGKHRHTVSYSHSRFSHYETRFRTHYASSQLSASYGFGVIENYNIGIADFENIASQFKDRSATPQAYTGFYSGDRNIYSTVNRAGVTIPTITKHAWVNKVRAAPSKFSFHKVDETVPVYNYPDFSNHFMSERILGDAAGKFSIRKFDEMCSRLGTTKKCNIIIVGFNKADQNLAMQQRDKWFGGKKNDIVICYGYAPLEGNVSNVVWAKCFGWFTNEEMGKNLEKLFMENPLDDNLLSLIEKEVAANYVKRDWKAMDLLEVQPTSGWYWALIVSMLVTQIGLYLFFNYKANIDFGRV